MIKRKPAVAGQFYSSDASELSEEVGAYIKPGIKKERAIGVLSPHAGLMYSGKVAGAVFSRIEFPETFIIISPNHTGLGSSVSIMTSGEWQMPTGDLTIDEDLAGKITGLCGVAGADPSGLAHLMEHSIEVQLPFILHISKDVRIVPVTLMTDSLDTFRMLGEAIADAVKDAGYSVTIVASSDMSHYEEETVARSKDKKAIDMILALNPEGLYNTVKKEGISMCGYGPATTMLYAANRLGASKAELIKYMTSGDVNRDYSQVVGYAGMIIK